MKKMFFIAFCAVILALNGLDIEFKANTGDANFDIHLNDVNIIAKAKIELFRTETAAEYKVSNSLMDEALIKLKMEPAELYLSLEMAKITKKEPAEVMKVYTQNKKEGWGVIAKKLGIKPGSNEFIGLKKKTQFKKEKHKREQMSKDKPQNGKIDKTKIQPIKESKKSDSENK